MWSIAHSQGIRLPSRDYWEFVELITVKKGMRASFDEFLALFHWTELIQSSPIAVEESVYAVVGGAYRKANITTLELRYNPMKRNRGGERDLDHIIMASIRGLDRASLEYPVKAGLIFCLDRSFDRALNEILVDKAIAYRRRGVVAIDIAGPVEPAFRFADYRDLSAQVRRAGLGVTVHAGETGGPEEVREAVEALEPERIGHGISSTRDPRVMGMLRERGIVLEVCPSSNLNTRVVRNVAELRTIIRALVDNEVRFALSTDGPEMLRSYLRDEIAVLLRHEILSFDEVQRAIETAREASFLRLAPVPGRSNDARDGATNGHAAIALEVEV